MNMGKKANVNRTKPVSSDKNNIKPVDDECRICFESLADNRKTPVQLRCGHQYHLDCIGSAFNVKNKMQCPTCKRVEHGKWLFAQSSPIPNPITGLVQPLPLGGDFAIPPVWHQPMLPSRRQLDMILAIPMLAYVGFIEPRREPSSVELTQQLQLAEDISRARMPPSVWDVPGSYNIRRSGGEHLIQNQARGMYGYDRIIGGGERGIYSRGRGCSVVTSGGERRMNGYDSIIGGGERGSYSRGRGCSVVTSSGERRMNGYDRIIDSGEHGRYRRGRGYSVISGGDTSRSGGTQQFRPMAMTRNGVTTRSGDVTRSSGGDRNQIGGTQQSCPMAVTRSSGWDRSRNGGDRSRSGGYKQFRPSA